MSHQITVRLIYPLQRPAGGVGVLVVVVAIVDVCWHVVLPHCQLPYRIYPIGSTHERSLIVRNLTLVLTSVIVYLAATICLFVSNFNKTSFRNRQRARVTSKLHMHTNAQPNHARVSVDCSGMMHRIKWGVEEKNAA